MPNRHDTGGKKVIELLAMAVDGIAILAIIYSAIIIRKRAGLFFYYNYRYRYRFSKDG